MEIKSSSQDKRIHNGKTCYHIREEYDNGETKDLSVEEAENGFIVTIEHYLPDNNKDEAKVEPYENRYQCKKYISPTNPLDGMDKKEKKEDTTSKDVAKSVTSFIQGMSNKLMI